MFHSCKDKCLTEINNCPTCTVAYEFVKSELHRLQRFTEDVLVGWVKDYFWTSPMGEVFLSIKLLRGVETLEQLNNEIQISFLSNRRMGLIKREWYLDGRIDHPTWETLGVVESPYNKFNTKHQIPVTIYNNHFVEGFSYFVDSTIDWMHSEDYAIIKEDLWTPEGEGSAGEKPILNVN